MHVRAGGRSHCAVSSIAARRSELADIIKHGLTWRLGHTLTLFAFATKTDVTVAWAHRNGVPAGESDALATTLAGLRLPAGDYYAWVACESLQAKALRRALIANHGANPKWLRAAGYWRRGAIAVHEVHEE